MKKHLVNIYFKLQGLYKYLVTYRDTQKNRNNIILIYSMGKVGSSTLYATLKKKIPTDNVFHVHFLSKYWIEQVLPKEHEEYHGNIRTGNKILKYIEDNPQKKIKIITLIREPVERELSDFFQNPLPMLGEKDLSVVNSEAILKKLISNDFTYSHSWFDTDFKNFTGIDVFALPFDKERGYSIYPGEKYDILFIKLEKLSVCYREAISQFINVDLSGLEMANETKDKTSYNKYKEIKSRIKVKKDRLLSVYQANHLDHFYTQKEISNFIDKWGI